MNICEAMEVVGSGIAPKIIYKDSPGVPSEPAPAPTPQPAMQPAPAERQPMEIRPKVLSMWPLDPAASGWFDDEGRILPQYRFGEKQVGYLHGSVLRTMLAWEDVYRPQIVAALAGNDPQAAKDAAALINQHVDGIQGMITPAIEQLLLAANDGLTAASKAFGEVTAELRAWPAASVPELIIKECIRYTDGWSYTTEKAAARFKEASQAWVKIQGMMTSLYADVRQLMEKQIAYWKQDAEKARARVAELEKRVKYLESGAGLLEQVRGNFEGLLESGKNAVNKALNAVGASLPSLAGGLGFGLVILLGAVAAAFALRR